MLIKAKAQRSYIPTTFDETMVEFGFKLERKRILGEVDDSLAKIEEAVIKGDKCEMLCDDVC